MLSYQMLKDTASQMDGKSAKIDKGAMGGSGGKKAAITTIAAIVSGCLDKNQIDQLSDDTLKDISNDEFTDADGTMNATLYKQAQDVSGKPTLEVVGQNVKIKKYEVLPDGSSSVTYTPADGSEQKKVVLGPENTLIVKSKDGKQHMIYGAQEMGGWTVKKSYTLHARPKDIDVPESKYNNNIIGDNPGDEVYATLLKGSDGKIALAVFYPKERKNGYGVELRDMSSGGKVNGPMEHLSTYGAEPVKGDEDILFKVFPLEDMNRILPGFDMIEISPDLDDYQKSDLEKGVSRIHVQNEKGWNTKGPFE